MKTIESKNSVSTLPVPLKIKARKLTKIDNIVNRRQPERFDEHSLNKLRKGLENEAAKDQTKTRLHKFISALQEQRKFEKINQFSPVNNDL